MQRSVKIALAAVLVVIVAGGAAFWYFVLRDTAAPEASLEALEQDSSSGSTADPIESFDGQWTVVTGENVFAGYRIQELFGGETIKKTATGRTPAVSGSLTVAGNQVSSVDITADLKQLKSDQSRRDASQQSSGLEINSFPTATFVLTQPITLPSAPSEGMVADVTAVGDLTLHGVTREVSIPLQASVSGGRINVAGGADIVLADFDISAPNSGFVTVDEMGTFEVQLAFTKA
jgi:polyisoprenoid-binding protein YceI